MASFLRRYSARVFHINAFQNPSRRSFASQTTYPGKRTTNFRFTPTTLRESYTDPVLLASLNKFRQDVLDSNLQEVLEFYPNLAQRHFLSGKDIMEVMRLLHASARGSVQSNLPAEKLASAVGELVTGLRSSMLPSTPRTSLHILCYYRLTGQFDAGIEYWNWVVKKREEHVNLAVYGAAIELLVAHGQSLAYCEAVYAHGIQRFTDRSAAYLLSSGAILQDPDQPNIVARTSGTLLQGIIKARLAYGDWKNAYLGLDTAMKLHPTQLPSHYFLMFFYDRPLLETYQVFHIICASGSRIPFADTLIFFGHISNSLVQHRGSQMDAEVVISLFSALHAALGSRQELTSDHLAVCIRTIALWFPKLTLDDPAKQAIDELLIQQIICVTHLFSLLNISLDDRILARLVALSEILKSPKLLLFVQKELESRPTTDSIKRSNLLRAAHAIGDLELIELMRNIHELQGQESAQKMVAELENTSSQRVSIAAPAPPAPIQTPQVLRSASEILASLERLKALIDSQGIYNLKDSLSMRTLIPRTNAVPEAASRALYAELNADAARAPFGTNEQHSFKPGKQDGSEQRFASFTEPTLSKHLPSGVGKQNPIEQASGDADGDTKASDNISTVPLSVSSEHHISGSDSGNSDKTSKIKSNHNSSGNAISTTSPPLILTPTGFPLGTLRFHNWHLITALLLDAAAFEVRYRKTVERAMRQGTAVEAPRSAMRLRHEQQKQLLRKQVAELAEEIDKNKEEASLTVEAWRERVLELRGGGIERRM